MWLVVGQVIESSNKHTSARIDKLEAAVTKTHVDMPRMIVKEILDNYSIEGIRDISWRDIQGLLRDSEKRLLEEVQKLKSTEPTPTEPTEPVDQEYPGGTLQEDGFRLWMWTTDGRFHMVPMNFCMPNCNLQHLFNLFLVGNLREKIQPYRHLRGMDMASGESDEDVRKKKARNKKSELAKARTAFKLLIRETPAFGGSNGNTTKQLQGESAEVRFEQFAQSFDVWLARLWPARSGAPNSDRRIGDVNWKTFYNLGIGWRKKNRPS